MTMSQSRPAKQSRAAPTKNPANARKSYERYIALAQAETLSGDRIAAENYYQHAEHYLRSLTQNSSGKSHPQDGEEVAA